MPLPPNYIIIPPYFIATTTINMQTVIFPRPTLASSRSSNEVKFPEDIQVILRADRQQSGSLYMGNIQAAENVAIIQSLRIGAILSVAKGRTTSHPKELVPNSKCIPVEENEQAHLRRYLQEGVDFIAQQLRSTNVLVHCVSGTNRSACFVIAYLIRHHALTLQDAYNEVKNKRKVVSPPFMKINLREGLLEQLRIFQRASNPRQTTRQATSVRQDRSIREDASGERTIRVKTKLPEEDDWERRSYRSNKSDISKASQRMSALNTSNIAMRNPEESFISKYSKAPSILNKSFRPPSQRCPSQVLQLDDLPELPILRLQKKSSSSRDQFTVKLRQLDSKNSQINNKIFQLHQRFDQENQTSRLTLESQLNEISQLRSNLNKSRLSRIAHDLVEYPQITTEP